MYQIFFSCCALQENDRVDVFQPADEIFTIRVELVVFDVCVVTILRRAKVYLSTNCIFYIRSSKS